MHTRVQSVRLDVDRTSWAGHGLRIGVLGDQNDRYYPIDRSPHRGVLDVLIDGRPVGVPPGATLPPPMLIDGHLVAPIVRSPDNRLALDVDEADRPITRSWRPRPADLRCERSTPDGMVIALDLTLTRPRTERGEAGPDNAATAELAVELVLQRGARVHTLPARLVPGSGTIGQLTTELPSALLCPGEHWMLSLRTDQGTGRLGLDLSVSTSGHPSARPSTAVTVVIVIDEAAAEQLTDTAANRRSRHVGACIGSTLDQTLPREHYEVLAVVRDDSDGIAGLLDWLATLHPRLRVLHTPPDHDTETMVREGVRAAHGEFVYFLQPSERLTPNALHDLLRYAYVHDSDIVAARTLLLDATDSRGPSDAEEGHGRGQHRGRTLAPATFRLSRPYAWVRGAQLAESLSPNKLFRTSLLDQHQLTFGWLPPDRQRFVAEAYLAASRIAVFADRVCCHRLGGDPDRRPVTAEQHATAVRDAVLASEKRAEDGGAHARFLQRWYRTEVLHRLRGEALLGLPYAERPGWVAQLAALAAEHFDPLLARGFPPPDQIVAQLLAREAVRQADGVHAPDPNTVQALVALAEWEDTIEAHAEAEWLSPSARALRITVRVGLGGHGAPVFRSEDHRRATFEPPAVAGSPGIGVDQHTVRRHLDDVGVEVIAEAPDGVTLRARCRAVRFEGSAFRVWADIPTVDVPTGRLRLDVRVRCCGWIRRTPVLAGADVLARQHRWHPPVPHVGHGPIAVDVPPAGGRAFAGLRTDPPRHGFSSGLRSALRALDAS